MARKRRFRQLRRKHARLVVHGNRPPGSTPGKVIGKPDAAPVAIHVIAYGPDALEERDIEQASDLAALRGSAPVLWVDVAGVGDAQALEQIGSIFGIHSLALEDVVNLHQRPKVEDYVETVFFVVRMPSYQDELRLEQVSVFLGDGFVITLQEDPGDCLDPVRRRIRAGTGRIRKMNADYLAHAVIDAIVDNYFPVIERYSDRLEELEGRILFGGDQETVHEIYSLRHDLHILRRVLWPTREATNLVARGGAALVGEEVQMFFRDCADHASQLIDAVESCRELVAGLMELHVSGMSNRMNEIMKVLTLIATIFIPLGFIAGVYGMNFDTHLSPWNMPELAWYMGYPFALMLMLVTAIGLLIYFWRKGWLGSRRSTDEPASSVARPRTHRADG